MCRFVDPYQEPVLNELCMGWGDDLNLGRMGELGTSEQGLVLKSQGRKLYQLFFSMQNVLESCQPDELWLCVLLEIEIRSDKGDRILTAGYW